MMFSEEDKNRRFAMRPFQFLKTITQQAASEILGLLPRRKRFRISRYFAEYDPAPNPRLVLKVAETREELEACFRLLHDTYVRRGFMQPEPSGMRVTIYHALPTTTTLCAKYDGKVVGTLSLIRESAIGFPLQRIFDLSSVRAKRGNLAEASALAIDPGFQGQRGMVLLPLMKFMYEYCTTFFDTRHLVIAVHPRHVETYESLLFFRRLSGTVVGSYDFVNGAPAVGATLDLKHAPEILRKHYGNRPLRRNLHHYFVAMQLPNIEMPNRRFYTTNDPVMTPELIDYFFNRQTEVFASLSERKKGLLHMIYDIPEYQKVLPPLPPAGDNLKVRLHRRFSVKCPGRLAAPEDEGTSIAMEISEVSRYGFRARTKQPITPDIWLTAVIQLGRQETSLLQVRCVQDTQFEDNHRYGFQIGEPDLIWRKFVNALYDGSTQGDLDNATRFLSRE
jgi:hypothetical protein